MFVRIKNRVDEELASFAEDLNKAYLLDKISPLLYRSIREFMLRPGKRVRPMLFILGYLGYSRKTPPGLFRSAVSLELLHDFMLVHDDIIDRSDMRRGKPSMHKLLERQFRSSPDAKFTGQDLALIIGDVMYALALQAFLAVKEKKTRKERALKLLIETAIYTGSGELIELLAGARAIDRIAKEDIYKIYDLKTANYTFASPLRIGATLAGASEKDLGLLYKYGIYLGRAFQIKDDYLGIFGSPEETGKSNLTDLQESKKTVFIWYAFNHSGTKDKAVIKKIFAQKNPCAHDLLRLRRFIFLSGAVEYARHQITLLIDSADSLLGSCSMFPARRTALAAFSKKLLAITSIPK